MLRTAVVVAALAVTAPAGPGSAEEIPAAACTGGGRVLAGPGNWQMLTAPQFMQLAGIGEAPQEVVSYAVAPLNPKLVAVTNGKAIHVSHNGGCTWDEGLRLDQVPTDTKVPLSGSTTTIKSLYITWDGTLLATAETLDTGATVGHPHVIRSKTGARGSWSTADSGLPPLGHPLLMRGARSPASTVYLSFSAAREESTTAPCPPAPLPCPPGGGQQGRTLGLLWGSNDGGATWSSRSDPNDLNGVSAIKYYSVDPYDGNVLWAVANGRLRRSDNGGRSYTDPAGLDQDEFDFTAVEAIQDRGLGLQLVAFSANDQMIRLQKNKWERTTVRFGGAVESVAQRPKGDIAVATSAAGGGLRVWRIFGNGFRDYDEGTGVSGKELKATYGWESITPGTRIDVDGHISSTAGSVETFFLRDKRRILRFTGSSLDVDKLIAPPTDLRPPPQPQGKISPSALTLELPPGGTKTVPYTLTLPPAPTPLELFLLIDNSGSMDGLIGNLKQNLGEVARSLNHSGTDVRMGIGRINVQPTDGKPPIDDPRTPNDESKPRPLYERLRQIGPIDGNLFAQLSTLDGNGGSGDEAQLESLYQMATGEGMSTLGLGALIGYQVEPQQQAGFSQDEDTIKVVIHATDEPFSVNIRNGHNDWHVVAAALKNAGIKQIGLSQGVEAADRDLRQVAQATGALAPRGGTDCDGDNHVDLAANTPLVCPENYGLDKTLLNLLRSLSDRQTIMLNAKANEVLRSVTRSAFPIDAKRATRQTFKVTYSCVGLAPGVYDSNLSASLRGGQIARAAASVSCGGPPGGFPRNPPLAPGSVPDNPPPVPQPNPPIAPIAPAQPVSQPQTQVQSQSQLNPQSGAADQEQEQAQLALAGNDVGSPDEETVDELAMSALEPDPRRLPGSALALYGAGLGMTAAAGVALRRRTRTQHARATVTGR